MLERWLGLERVRRRLLGRAPDGPLRDYLSVPFPRGGADCHAVGFAAVDLETTGLDAAKDRIVSVGWVCLEGDRIDLATAGYRLVLPGQAMPEASAVVHRITDDAAARGSPPREVLGALLGALRGRVLVAHNAAFELAFLDAACQRELGGRFVAPAVDTLALGVGWLERRDAGRRPADLRLDAMRRRHGLPRYRAHDALTDALAAAELFAAQLSRMEGRGRVKLRRVLMSG